jgi:nucleobase:cation symporter-1, NCS1 family
VPAVEGYGVEPIPPELRTVGWRDLFAINFTFFLNPVMYVLGALAVVDGGLPIWWAVAATVLGQALAFGLLVIVAQPGVDYGLPGQVAMRASLGVWGARGLSSPYRMIAATYWFAAQALAGALGIQAVVVALGGGKPPLVPVALALAVFHATLAVLGFDVMRYVLRVVLPVSLVLTAVLVVLYLSSDDPRYAVGRVFHSPDQQLTWTGFATYITVMCGASLTLVTNVADLCRYTPTRRDLRIGLFASAVLAVAVTTFVGGYAAAATGELNPFIAVADLTNVDALLVLLLAAIVIQGIAANITNVYTAGLSLVNAVPALGRFAATLIVGIAAVVLSGFPAVIEEAQTWIAHLGNIAAPLTGVIVADYLVVKCAHLEVKALFDRHGRYRYVSGVNVAALLAVAAGAGMYYAVPQAWLKVVWGLAAGAIAYLALEALQRVLLSRRGQATTQKTAPPSPSEGY